MLDLSCCGIRRLGGWLAAAVVCVCGAGAIPAQEDESAVALRDAEGYEVPAQGWVKAPSFLLDHLGDAFSPTVMDIAENAEFTDPVTIDMTKKDGLVLRLFNPVGGNFCPGILNPIRFSLDDKWVTTWNYCFMVAFRIDVNTGEESSGCEIETTTFGGMGLCHDGEDMLIWGESWGPDGYGDNRGIYLLDAATGEIIKLIFSPDHISYGGIEEGTSINLDGSRLYIFHRVNMKYFLYVVDIDTEQIIRAYDQASTPCKMSRDGSRLMVRNIDGTTDLVDTMTDEIVYTFDDLPPVDYYDAATENHNVLIVFEDGTCTLLNTDKFIPRTSLDFISDETNTLRLSHDGTRALARNHFLMAQVF